jgi:hypothetical protein
MVDHVTDMAEDEREEFLKTFVTTHPCPWSDIDDLDWVSFLLSMQEVQTQSRMRSKVAMVVYWLFCTLLVGCSGVLLSLQYGFVTVSSVSEAIGWLIISFGVGAGTGLLLILYPFLGRVGRVNKAILKLRLILEDIHASVNPALKFHWQGMTWDGSYSWIKLPLIYVETPIRHDQISVDMEGKENDGDVLRIWQEATPKSPQPGRRKSKVATRRKNRKSKMKRKSVKNKRKSSNKVSPALEISDKEEEDAFTGAETLMDDVIEDSTSTKSVSDEDDETVVTPKQSPGKVKPALQ